MDSSLRLLRWAAEQFAGRTALTCSFGGPGGLILAHMIFQSDLAIPILFIDTELLFPETYQLRDTFARKFHSQVITVKSKMNLAEQAKLYGENLWNKDPDKCCHLRKVAPLEQALQHLDAWISALRRDQSATRQQIEMVEYHVLPNNHRICKLHPLAHWTQQQIWQYIDDHDIPYNPLCDQGYKSIGCVPCTQPAENRSGRWTQSKKVECGIHTFTNKRRDEIKSAT